MDPQSHDQSAIFAHVVERATLQRVNYLVFDSVEEDKEWEAEERNKGPAPKVKDATGVSSINDECEWQVVQRRKKGRSKGKGTAGSSNYNESDAKVSSNTKCNRGLQVVERNKGLGLGFILRCWPRHRRQGSYRMDFHTINLEKGEIYLNSLPPIMVKHSTIGNMFRSDSMIYLIGGKKDLHPPPDVQLHQYDGASCLDLSPSRKKWVKTTAPEVSGPFYLPARYCVSLCGKIYSFGAADCRAEVYDPNGGCKWKKLSSIPSGVDDTAITLPVLPDPDNERLLVHLKKSDKLYAFYPLHRDGQGEWLFITKFGLVWECAIAVSENIIYFSAQDYDSDLFTTYDIIKKEGLSCFWSNRSMYNLPFANVSLYPGNNGRMYLVSSYIKHEMVPAAACVGDVDDETTRYIRGDSRTVIAFLKFRVKRVENSGLAKSHPPLKLWILFRHSRLVVVIYFSLIYL